MKDRPSYLRRRINSFRCAIKGVVTFLFSEEHALIHTVAAVMAIALGFWLNITWQEWLAICLSIGVVFTAEMVNTALEKLTDIAHPEHGEQAGRVKDIAAGAVLMASLAALAVGLIIFLPKLG